jgi:hypothetical protein
MIFDFEEIHTNISAAIAAVGRRYLQVLRDNPADGKEYGKKALESYKTQVASIESIYQAQIRAFAIALLRAQEIGYSDIRLTPISEFSVVDSTYKAILNRINRWRQQQLRIQIEQSSKRDGSDKNTDKY